MTASSLQDGIDQAGSPLNLLWKPNAAPWLPEVVESEYAGWRAEQRAWHEGVAFLELSHHMSDTFLRGPDATRLLMDVSANELRDCAIGQAKQFVPVTPAGHIVSDGILLREDERSYTLSGPPTAHNWVKYHAEKDDYDVTFSTDPSSAFRGGAEPALFRYQIQGPLASDLVERAFGGPLPRTKFFHSTPVTLEGSSIRALRHGMAGQPGYEFIGNREDALPVREALVRAGEPLGLVHVGALAYTTASVESGWIPTPVPGIYTDPELDDYRRHLPLASLEGQRRLHGSFFSESIEDYYSSPYELGYGRIISFDHDFIGRDALLRAKDDVSRTKVTLVFDPADARAAMGTEPEFTLSYARQRVEARDGLVGITCHSASLDPAGTVLSLALVDNRFAEPGTEVSVVWGDHPGPGTAPDADLGFPRIRATVAPAPYDEYARTLYRGDA
ncbi:aminomethyltransferase family protein [Actinopolyspora halophila]|uniref:aminomethyltransferase family protein n=1 Tax=Actinopolyspora halophila TaxID=1850 RepID=UPI00037CCCA7|nr:aminomethyltransferase family protein [Actinopolyspora halophila]